MTTHTLPSLCCYRKRIVSNKVIYEKRPLLSLHNALVGTALYFFIFFVLFAVDVFRLFWVTSAVKVFAHVERTKWGNTLEENEKRKKRLHRASLIISVLNVISKDVVNAKQMCPLLKCATSTVAYTKKNIWMSSRWNKVNTIFVVCYSLVHLLFTSAPSCTCLRVCCHTSLKHEVYKCLRALPTPPSYAIKDAPEDFCIIENNGIRKQPPPLSSLSVAL